MDEVEIKTVDQVPDDPLKMPPPYWRCSGAIFHLNDALEELFDRLFDLEDMLETTEPPLATYYLECPESKDDPELERFAEICDELWVSEHKVKLKAELACLMSAIQIEDELNEFCVFNLHKDIAETIEKLSPPEKLLIASAVVGQTGVKGVSAFQELRKLTAWRNAFAHGHCVDRPTKSLRHNHLISPEEYPDVASTLRDAIGLVSAFLIVSDYLREISINPSTAEMSGDNEEARDSLIALKKLRMVDQLHLYKIVGLPKRAKKNGATIAT